LYGLLIILSVVMVLPLVWMLSTSLKAPGAPQASFLPGANATLQNYARVFREAPFGRYFINSIVVAAVVTLGQLATSAMAAFAFARLQFKGRNLLFFGYLATMMIPAAVLMVPQFMLLTRMPVVLNSLFQTTWFSDEQYLFGRWYAGVPLGVDSYFVLIVPLLFSPYGTFLLRQFFLGIPKELDEAAAIDGCTRFQIFRWVILPLSKPALATLGVFTFMGSWRNFLWPLIMTNSTEMQTLPVGLAGFQGFYETDWPVMMSGAVLAIVPMILIFVFCQRFFVKGIQMGAVKG
jgi:multiple sugar transport system permease protein